MKAVVVGAGIAGSSTAYFLSRAGFTVTVIDAGVHTASHVPSALLNPVRGQSGQVEPQLLAGLQFTWELVRELEAAGYTIPHAQSGVLRPVPDDRTRAKFERHLPTTLNHQWLAPGDSPDLLPPGWAHVLSIPEGGWVEGRALCEALLAASGAQRIRGTWAADERPTGEDNGSPTVFCGGSLGSNWAGETGTHRMGSVLLLEHAPCQIPLSFGAYLSPDARGGVLGGTFETPSPSFSEPALPLPSLAWLLGKGEALADLRGLHVRGQWTGSRLSNLRYGKRPDGFWELRGLSSKGFLLGPLLAAQLAQDIAAEFRASRVE